MNKNETYSKLRVFFWLVPLLEGRYRREAPYADVAETLGLRGGGKYSQKWPKMAKNDKREKTVKNPTRSLNKLGFWANLTVKGWK